MEHVGTKSSVQFYMIDYFHVSFQHGLPIKMANFRLVIISIIHISYYLLSEEGNFTSVYIIGFTTFLADST